MFSQTKNSAETGDQRKFVFVVRLVVFCALFGIVSGGQDVGYYGSVYCSGDAGDWEAGGAEGSEIKTFESYVLNV